MGCLYKIKGVDYITFFCTVDAHTCGTHEFLNYIKESTARGAYKTHYLINPSIQPESVPKEVKLIRNIEAIQRINNQTFDYFTAHRAQGCYYFVECSNIPKNEKLMHLWDVATIYKTTTNRYFDNKLYSWLFHVPLSEILFLLKKLEQKTIPNIEHKRFYS